MLRRYQQLLPTLILAAFCFSTIITAIGGKITIDGTEYDFALGVKQYSAFVMVAVSLTSFFLSRKYYKYLFTLTFLLGLFGLINFTVTQTSWGILFGEVHIGLSPVLTVVGLVTYLLNHQKVNSLVFALIKPSEEKIARVRREETAEFKRKFSRKTNDELAQIVTDNTLVYNALIAAQQLLEERR